MPETCENWFDLVNSCIYYARQTREIYLALPYSMDSKAPQKLWNPVIQYLVNIVYLEDLRT